MTKLSIQEQVRVAIKATPIIWIDAAEADTLRAADSIGAPAVFIDPCGQHWAIADELRKWRAKRASQAKSGSEHG